MFPFMNMNPQFESVTRKLFTFHSTDAPSLDIIPDSKLLKTDRERFTVALKYVLRYQTDRWFKPSCEQKNSKRSIRLREDGNESYKDGRYKKAVLQYTESAMYAVDSSVELAWTYANRSAALYKLKKYDDCIKDIDRALSLGIPDRSKTGLYKRKGLCLKALGTPGFESSLREAMVWLEKLGMSEEQMNKTRTKLEEECTSLPFAKPTTKSVQYPVPEIIKPSPEAPCASDAVAVKYSEKFGRHLVATRKIKAGELLILEKPYCSKVEEENISTHCAHCLQESWSLIPCKCCIYVAYCSKACEDEAWTGYHEIECLVVGYLVDYKFVSPLWIGMKTAIMATQRGTKLDSLKKELEDVDRNPDPRTMGFSDDGKFISSQYRSVYSLSNNADKCSVEHVVERSLWVALTVCVMARETNMFGKKMTLDDTLLTNPDIIFVGELILKHLFICYSNMFSYGSVNGDLTTQYADGVVPFCSFLNHSCDTNTLRQWCGDRQAVYALLPVEEGEQIFDNYGARCCDMSLYERRQTLKNWKFVCECPPCTEDWPNLWDMRSYKRQSIQQQKKNILDKMMQTLRSRCADFLRNSSVGKFTSMMNQLLEAIETLTRVALKPCKELYTIVRVVQMYHWSGDAIFNYVPGRSASDFTSAPAEFHRRLVNLCSMISG